MSHVAKRAALILLAIALSSTSSLCSAYFEPTETGKKPREMNGVFFDRYKDFTKNWHLVTVRFRQDSGEQRFVYANDIAFKALRNLKPDYPDGAMFAKAAFATEDDLAFPSSKVPSGAKRYQYMLKNKKKYPDSDGWGYALFDERGNLFNEDMTLKTQSCVACHRIVPERDYVFSRQMMLHQDSQNWTLPSRKNEKSVVQFENAEFSKAPASVKALSGKYDIFNSLIGSLRDHAFSGTLDEVVPLLTDKSRMNGAPSGLIIDEKNFSLVLPAPQSKKCAENVSQKAYRIVIQFNAKVVRDAEACL